MLLLGGNLGDTRALLRESVGLIARRVGRVVSCSSELESEPWGFGDCTTAKFVNQAVWVECEMSEEELLDVTQQIEIEVGRERDVERREKSERGELYASRRIDIDIIFYGERLYRSDRLVIPHPLLQQREFVLRPIVEIAPEWRHVVLGVSCRELLAELEKIK